jgi:hypothetical protein
MATHSTALKQVVSGGQLGADRAALDVAISYGLANGGWCPRNRLCEDPRPIPSHYDLKETTSQDYAQRTKWNVRDSDGTVVFTRGAKIGQGSQLTLKTATRLGKPHLHADLLQPGVAGAVANFIHFHSIATLNVAGTRLSRDPEIDRAVRLCLAEAFRQLGLKVHYSTDEQ